MDDVILETMELSKRFSGKLVVDRVSLQVARGSIYALLGPNGAGKTTTMKMLLGMLRPTAGGIHYNGHALSRRDLREIGALIETPAIYPNLTARENLSVRTTLYGLPKAQIDETLELVKLTGAGKKRAGQFSLGMKQRLGIAIALIQNPDLLILDEPANGLDPASIQAFRELLRSFPGRGMTVLLSSHILSEVAKVADYIGIIANGRLKYQGPAPDAEALEPLYLQMTGEAEA